MGERLVAVPYYISTWAGSGTRAEPFVPVAAPTSGAWSCIDLRPDVTVVAGYALVWTETALSPVPTGAWLLAATPDSALSTQVRNRLSSFLRVTVASGTTLRQAVRLLMTTEATGPAKGRWRAVVPTLGRLRVVLGDLDDSWTA